MNEERKAALIEKYRDINVDHNWWDCTCEGFERICTILGIELEQRSVPLMNGEVRYEPDIQFSGFWSQGDGAAWSGSYRTYTYEAGWKHKVSTYDLAPAGIREYCNDEELHRIADELCMLARLYYPAFARIATSGQHCHSGTMNLSVFEPMDGDPDDWAQEVHTHVEETLTQLFRDLADWLYVQLEKEYDYQTSDEAVWDTIQANELDEPDEGEEAA